MRHLLTATTGLAALAASLLAIVPAHATLEVAIRANGASFHCVDNDPTCDLNSSTGTLQLGDQVLGGVDVNGSLQTRSQSNGQAIITGDSLSIQNNSGSSVPITVTVSATNYHGPTTSVETTGSGTWVNAVGSNVTYSYFDDPLNRQGATFPGDTPGNQVDIFQSTVVSAAQSFSHDLTNPVSDPGLFSMTLEASGLLVNGGELLSRGQAEIKNVSAPEPAGLLLFGIGLLGLGLVRSSRRFH